MLILHLLLFCLITILTKLLHPLKQELLRRVIFGKLTSVIGQPEKAEESIIVIFEKSKF